MTFTQKILEKIGMLFLESGLEIYEQEDNYLKLKLKALEIGISHNPYDKCNTIWIGKNDNTMNFVEISDEILKLFFHSDLKLNQLTEDDFIDNLLKFFNKEWESLKPKNSEAIELDNLLNFGLYLNKKYTEDLTERQILNAANIAWDEKNYKQFIKIVTQINKDKLPASYQLKLNIANKKHC